MGNDVVICIMRKDDDNIDGCNDNDDGHNGSLEIIRFPSKKHSNLKMLLYVFLICFC